MQMPPEVRKTAMKGKKGARRGEKRATRVRRRQGHRTKREERASASRGNERARGSGTLSRLLPEALAIGGNPQSLMLEVLELGSKVEGGLRI